MRLLVTAALLLLARTAHAECGVPTWFGTSSSQVPTRGALYVYQADRGWDEGQAPPPLMSWHGSGIASVTPISPTVQRIDYAGSPGSELTVWTRWNEDEPVHYKLAAAWQPPARPPRVLQYWHDAYEWTCSFSDSLMIQVDQDTAAFRVRWMSATTGETTELVQPARTEEGRSALELGKLDCAGTSIDPDDLRHGGWLELTAIRVDGSEVRVEGVPARLSTAQMPTDDAGLEHALDLRSFTPPAPPAPAVTPRAPASDGPLLGFLVVALASLGGAIAWRTRVRVPDGL